MHKYRILLQYAQRRRSVFVLIFVLTFLSSVLASVQPWPMKLLVDHVLGHAALPSLVRSGLSLFGLIPTPMVLLLLVTWGGLVLFALNSILEVALTRAWTITGRRMVYDLAEDLFARLQRRPLLFHVRNSVGDTMSRVTVDSWS